MDVLEIDGASNRGIDEIRDLREKVRLAPLSASKKVYIIDEVHMLTPEAFNALLKTLEEPPAHVIFVLCTTDPQKIPPTIVSRCFHIGFVKATEKELVRSLKRIVIEEKIKITDNVLASVASLADGSFRDAAKYLEELSKLAKKEAITKELVEEKYHIENVANYTNELLQYLSKKDRAKALQLVSELYEKGVDMKFLIEKLIEELHKMLLSHVGVIEKESKNVTYELSLIDIKTLLSFLTRAHSELKYAVLSQLPLELVVIEWCGLNSTEQNEGTTEKVVSFFDRRGSKDANQKYVNQKIQTEKPAAHSSISASMGETKKIWGDFIDLVKQQNYSVAGVLRGCRLSSFDGKTFVIETNYKFHKDRLSDKKVQELMEQVCAQLSGNPVVVSVLLRES